MLSLHPGHRTGTAEHHRIRCGNLSLHPGITDKPGPFCDGLCIIAALPSASRWGHYGAPGNVDSASDAAGWSPQEQQAATDFAVQTMRVFAMDTDAATWHQHMDSRVTDDYRQQLSRFNPSLNPVHEVKNAVYTEFPSDPTRAVVRVATNDGVWVVQLRRSGPGDAPKVANIGPLSVKKN